MKAKLLLMRLLLGLSGGLLAAAPTVAFAHENVGGDELAAANWMLIGAFVVALMGVLAGLWAWSTGQFSNVEESKYKMLDTAEDFDDIMAEADALDNLLNTNAKSASNRPKLPAPVGRARV